jgi:hypothetical protein
LIGVLVSGVFVANGCAPESVKQPRNIKVELEWIRVFTRTLETEGLGAVLTVARTNGWRSPLIHSKYWVDRFVKQNPNEIKLERAIRGFGRDLALALDAEAKRLQTPLSSTDRIQAARLLFDLSDWLKEARGYGNCFLVGRCQDLATVPLAHLIADLNQPLTELQSLAARFLPEDEYREIRVAVLNGEAPKKIIGTLRDGRLDKDSQLWAKWGRGYEAVENWYKEKRIQGRIDDPQVREQAPDELAIFLDDDDRTVPATTSGLWDKKLHFALVMGGPRGGQIESIQKFLLFREKVGRFPTKPVFTEEQIYFREKEIAEAAKRGFRITRFEESYQSLLEAGFAQAWEPYRSQYGPLYGIAAMVYERVKSGKFLDQDSEQFRDYERTKARQ